MREDHPFAQLVLGHVIHVTGVDGYEGIRRDGAIRPNFGDLKATWGNQRGDPYYYCQKRKAVSVLDLKHADRVELFDESSLNFQNWLHVFTYHKPGIVLFLDLGDQERDLFYCSGVDELTEDKTKHILEAEACFPGPIPVDRISRILVTYGSVGRCVDTGVRELTEDQFLSLKYAKVMCDEASQILMPRIAAKQTAEE